MIWSRQLHGASCIAIRDVSEGNVCPFGRFPPKMDGMSPKEQPSHPNRTSVHAETVHAKHMDAPGSRCGLAAQSFPGSVGANLVPQEGQA